MLHVLVQKHLSRMEKGTEVQWICTDIVFLLHEAQHISGTECSMHAAENIMYRTPSVLQFTCEVPELQRRTNWTNRVEQKDGRAAHKLA